MRVIREEIHVEHDGNTFRRVYDINKNKLYWQLCQTNDEAELWSTLSEAASNNLNKEFYDYVSVKS